MGEAKAPNPDRLMQLAWGYAPTLIVATAVRFRLFEHLADGPRSVAQLTATTGTSGRGMSAILNALVGLRLLERRGDGYTLTPESAAFLLPGRPEYRGTFFHHHIDQLLPQWLQLEHIVRTGQPAVTTNRAGDAPAYFAGFVESLFAGSYPAAQDLGRHLRIPEAVKPVRVLDLGAGSGVWGIALAEQSQQVRVTAVDWPRVLDITREMAVRHRVGGQFSAVPGDLFSVDFGQAYDVALLGHILHSEGPDRIQTLLRKTSRALVPGGVIAIQEFLPDDDRQGPLMPLLFAVNMLVNTEAGGTYTFAEISRWLRECGFRDPRSLAVPAVSPLILADKE